MLHTEWFLTEFNLIAIEFSKLKTKSVDSLAWDFSKNWNLRTIELKYDLQINFWI